MTVTTNLMSQMDANGELILMPNLDLAAAISGVMMIARRNVSDSVCPMNGFVMDFGIVTRKRMKQHAVHYLHNFTCIESV